MRYMIVASLPTFLVIDTHAGGNNASVVCRCDDEQAAKEIVVALNDRTAALDRVAREGGHVWKYYLRPLVEQ